MKELYLLFELIFGVNEIFLKQKTNRPCVTEYRFLMAWTIRKSLKWPYEAIQLELGYKTHQNIVHAVKSVNDWNENNIEIQKKVAKIKSGLRLIGKRIK